MVLNSRRFSRSIINLANLPVVLSLILLSQRLLCTTHLTADQQKPITDDGGALSDLFGLSSKSLPAVNEMLVPANSTTALICDLVFDFDSSLDPVSVSARWIKDGRTVGIVNRHSNLILSGERRVVPKKGGDPAILAITDFPAIGFIIIANTQLQDQGEYWCERILPKDGGKRTEGEHTRLTIAFLENLDPGEQPRVAFFDDTMVVLECPTIIKGVPPPIVSWLFNGEPVDFSSRVRLEISTNGSLIIHRFSTSDSGNYACAFTNLAGHTQSASLFLPSGQSLSINIRKQKCVSPAFLLPLRDEIVWILGLFLAVGFPLLICSAGFILFTRICSKQNRRRQRRQFEREPTGTNQELDNSSNRQCAPIFNLMPGFRKTIAPISDTFYGIIHGHVTIIKNDAISDRNNLQQKNQLEV